MKLIKQSFEFINQTDFSLVGIKKHIERCARVSYRSEDKITEAVYQIIKEYVGAQYFKSDFWIHRTDSVCTAS